MSASAASAAAVRRALSVRVGATLLGGPTLSLTPPRKWAPDTPTCEVCAVGFSLARRRHHCRICGSCVCGACSAHNVPMVEGQP
jgi:hypothetical protein